MLQVLTERLKDAEVLVPIMGSLMTGPLFEPAAL